MTDALLVVNAGSSSIKFAVYEGAALSPVVDGKIDAIGEHTRFSGGGPQAAALADVAALPPDARHADAIRWLLDALRLRLPHLTITAAGHRVVHGGLVFTAPMLVDEKTLIELQRLTPLAPNHQPHNIDAIRAVARAWPELPQVVCFDTAFHRTQPRLAQLFALPHALTDEGIIRYGFHGLSYEYIAGVLPDVAGARADGRIIVAHLGNGASLCAMSGRRSIATTMGFTTLDGLVMGTRGGRIDPGVILHLLETKRWSVDDVADLLSERCGLLGVSGISGDVRELEASADPRAVEALDLFAYRAASEIGSFAAALDGLDAIVFTAGIGEHSATMRARIASRMRWLGLALDERANAAHETRISTPDSTVAAYVIPTDEEIVIARATRALTAA